MARLEGVGAGSSSARVFTRAFVSRIWLLWEEDAERGAELPR